MAKKLPGLPESELAWVQSSESNGYIFKDSHGRLSRRYYCVTRRGESYRNGRPRDERVWFTIVRDPQDTKGRKVRTFVSEVYVDGLVDADIDLFFSQFVWAKNGYYESFEAAEVDAFDYAYSMLLLSNGKFSGLKKFFRLNRAGTIDEEIDPKKAAKQKYRRTIKNRQKEMAENADRDMRGLPAKSKPVYKNSLLELA